MAGIVEGTNSSQLFKRFADHVKKHEEELGSTVTTAPTSADLNSVVKIIERLETFDDIPAAECKSLIDQLAAVSDKWIYPDSDPIGAQLHPILERTIAALCDSFSEAIPEIAEHQKKWQELRLVRQAVQRRLYIDSLNPGRLERLRRWLSRGAKR
jgi:hypothetical protein